MRNKIWIPEVSTDINKSEKNTIDVPIVNLKGLFYIELIDANTGKIKEAYQFSNTITDRCMNALGSRTALVWGDPATGSNIGNALNNAMQLGAGSSAATGTDTNLQTPYTTGGNSGPGRTTANGGISDTNGYVTASVSASISQSAYYYYRYSRLFDEAMANGPIREIGIWNNQDLMVRTLIRDVNGNPITINKTNQEQVRVTYEYRMFPPTTGSTSVIVLGNTSHSISIMPANTENVNLWGGGGFGLMTRFGGWNANPINSIQARAWGSGTRLYGGVPTGSLFLSGSGLSPGSASYPTTYSLKDYYRDVDFIWNTSDGNHTLGIGVVSFALFPVSIPSTDHFAIQFDPAISKTDLQRLTLRFRFSWNRSGSGNV